MYRIDQDDFTELIQYVEIFTIYNAYVHCGKEEFIRYITEIN